MAVLTIPQAYSYAIGAGFSGPPAITIVAIAKAESGLDTLITHSQGNSAGVDRGILQINSFYHPEVSDAAAFNPSTAFAAAYRISNGGQDFTQWATYTTKNPLLSYKRYVSQVQSQVTQAGIPQHISQSQARALFGWMGGILNPSQNYNPPVEWGNDLGLAVDTKVYSPYAGTIGALTREPDGKWGCVIAIKLNEVLGPHTRPTFYIQHMDAFNSQLVVGQPVQIGTFLGWSGGENNTSQIPKNTNGAPYHSINGVQFSSGGHLELGFNGPNGPAWAPNGPSFDPHEFLVSRYNSLISGTIPISGDTTPSQAVTLSNNVITTLGNFIPTLAGTAGKSMTFAELCQRIDFAEEWVFWNPNTGGFNLNPLAGFENTLGQFTDNLSVIAIRGVYGGLGVVLALVGGYLLVVKPTVQVVEKVAPAALNIASML